MDLFLGTVTLRLLGDDERNVGVAGNVEIEDLALVGC